MNLILMGPQGSGKTTQAALLGKFLQLPHVSTGDIYRQIAAENNELGRRIKACLENGLLIDDETTFQIVDRHLSEIKTGFIVDGFPRTLSQAKKEPFVVDKVIAISVPEDECIHRLLDRKREDDTRQIIVARLAFYHQETEPILDYYKQQGKLVEIDGVGTIEEVQERIREKLK